MKKASRLPVNSMPEPHAGKPGIESETTSRSSLFAPSYRGANKLLDRVALITGGDSGIGSAVAILFAREGADVAIIFLPEYYKDAQITQEAVQSEGRKAMLIHGDVTDVDFCRQAVEHTVRDLGRIDILVNNVEFQQSRDRLEDITAEQWDKTFRTNIYGYFQMTNAALAYLKSGGSIINTGSMTVFEGSETSIDYAATKGAIHAFTKSLALNLAHRKIRVNCVAPGCVAHNGQSDSKSTELLTIQMQKTPTAQLGQPEQVAPAYVFFACNADSGLMSGEVMTLRGGGTTTS